MTDTHSAPQASGTGPAPGSRPAPDTGPVRPASAPGREAIAEGLGIPPERVTDQVLDQIGRDPMFLHHLELCRDDPEMLYLLLTGTGQEARPQNGAGPGRAAPGNAELLGRAGAAFARWAAAGFSRVPQPVYQRRLRICDGCPQLTTPPRKVLYRMLGTTDGRTVCGLCGCDVRRKAALASESCPAGRWEETP